MRTIVRDRTPDVRRTLAHRNQLPLAFAGQTARLRLFAYCLRPIAALLLNKAMSLIVWPPAW